MTKALVNNPSVKLRECAPSANLKDPSVFYTEMGIANTEYGNNCLIMEIAVGQ